jgi:hypothetical protein
MYPEAEVEAEAEVKPCRRSTMSSKSRCKFCYRRERMNDPTAKSVEIKKRCANPTNGCIVCNEYVCAVCWPLHVEEVKRRRSNNDSNKRPRASTGSNAFKSGSVVMESLFRTNGTNWDDFLETQWEKKPHFFTYDADIMPSAKKYALLPSAVPASSCTSSVSSTSIASTQSRNLIPAKYGGDGCWRETSVIVFPLREIIRQGWHILTTLMGVQKTADETVADYIGNYCHDTMMKISILQNFQPKTRDEILSLYGGDLYTSYLSGCSIDWENCDMLSPHLAALCQDLQSELDQKDETKSDVSFSQAYATAHLTPPQYSETCPPINNDRNILIFQLIGRKYWKISWRLSYDSSSSKEQVGKSGTTLEPKLEESSGDSSFSKLGDSSSSKLGDSSSSKLGDSSSSKEQVGISEDSSFSKEQVGKSGTTLEPNLETSSFDGYLYPGDILYIPRGMSYQTKSQIKTTGSDDSEGDPSISFHITVALDVTDESIAKKRASTVDNRPPESVLPDIPSSSPLVVVPDALSSSNDSTNIVAEPETQDPRTIIDKDHNIALAKKRTILIEEAKRTLPDKKKRKGKMEGSRLVVASPTISFIPGANMNSLEESVGQTAASGVSYHTVIRASTQVERNHWQERLVIGNHTKSDMGIRLELRGVAKVIATRFASLTPVGGGKKVSEMCEIVKNTFEDKSEISLVCDLTLLALIKREVQAGNLAVVHSVF